MYRCVCYVCVCVCVCVCMPHSICVHCVSKYVYIYVYIYIYIYIYIYTYIYLVMFVCMCVLSVCIYIPTCASYITFYPEATNHTDRSYLSVVCVYMCVLFVHTSVNIYICTNRRVLHHLPPWGYQPHRPLPPADPPGRNSQ